MDRQRAFATFALMAMPVAIAAPCRAANAPLAAVSKWSMNYDSDRCVLSRVFGQGKEQVLAQFISYAPSDGFEFRLAGPSLRTEANLPKLDIRFGDSGPFVRTWAISGNQNGLPVIFANGRLDNASQDDFGPDRRTLTPQAEAAVTSVQVKLGGRSWHLALGPMDKPMAALHTCEDALVRQWGLDPAAQGALAVYPTPRTSPGRWLLPGDYPSDQLSLGEQAIVVFRLMVDAEGNPTDCVVQSNIASDPAFAKTTCNLLKRRARFGPARTAEGTPVSSYYVNRVRWVIP